jgi:predicted nucleic acid-binding protein
MTIVVDASVAALWVLSQSGSDRAVALRTEPRLIAPTLVASEIGSALWKAVRRGDTTRGNALVAHEAALLAFHELMPDTDLNGRALEIAIELNHPIYDCFYLALAERERCPMVTADKTLLVAVKKFEAVEVRAL